MDKLEKLFSGITIENTGQKGTITVDTKETVIVGAIQHLVGQNNYEIAKALTTQEQGWIKLMVACTILKTDSHNRESAIIGTTTLILISRLQSILCEASAAYEEGEIKKVELICDSLPPQEEIEELHDKFHEQLPEIKSMEHLILEMLSQESKPNISSMFNKYSINKN